MQERKLLDWHMANLEFANAQLLQRLSMRSWDQDDPHELPGAHCFLPGTASHRVPSVCILLAWWQVIVSPQHCRMRPTLLSALLASACVPSNCHDDDYLS